MCFGLIDKLCLLIFHHIEFRMHMMFLNLLDLHRPKSAKPYMQRNMGNLHAFMLNLLQKLVLVGVFGILGL